MDDVYANIVFLINQAIFLIKICAVLTNLPLPSFMVKFFQASSLGQCRQLKKRNIFARQKKSVIASQRARWRGNPFPFALRFVVFLTFCLRKERDYNTPRAAQARLRVVRPLRRVSHTSVATLVRNDTLFQADGISPEKARIFLRLELSNEL